MKNAAPINVWDWTIKDNNKLEHLKNYKIMMEETEFGRQAIIFVSFADVYWECYALKSSHDIMRIL